MNLNLIKFIAGIVGLAVWAWLAFLGMTPVEPLIDLLKMGLGGLVVHMLTGGSAPSEAQPAPASISAGQGGFAIPPLLWIVAAVAVGICMLAGCSTTMRAWEAGAYNEAKASNDNTLAVLKVAFCAQPLSAFLRNSDMIPGAKALCLPAAGAADPAGLLDGKQSLTVNVIVPAGAASAPK